MFAENGAHYREGRGTCARENVGPVTLNTCSILAENFSRLFYVFNSEKEFKVINFNY